MSLYELLEGIKQFHYYDGNIINPITDLNKSWSFIEEYFKYGQKCKAFDLKFINKLRKKGKHTHSVVMYFMGILLKDIVFCKDSSKVKAYGLDEEGFFHRWFLTCLYHDVASVSEDDVDKFFNRVKCSCCLGNQIDIEHGIRYNLLEDEDYSSELTYEKNTIKKYLYYRYDAMRKIDHGIVGGLLLFDRLKKNYNEVQKSNKQNEEPFIYKGLKWSQQDLKTFAYIADTIISHNVWFGKDKKLYNRYGLDELICSPNKKLRPEDNPLLFLLALVDTIEPTKYFNVVEPNAVLRSIDMYLENKIIHININNSNLRFDGWIEKIKSLEEWLDVKVDSDDKFYVKIKMNSV